MNRRGFIGGLIGVAGVVVSGRTVQSPEVVAEPPVRVHQVKIDASEYRAWGAEGEKVLIDYIRRHQPHVRKILS